MLSGLPLLLATAAPAAFERLPAPATPSDLPHEGTIQRVERFRDRLGTHTLLLTNTGPIETTTTEQIEDEPGTEARLYAYDYLDTPAGPQLQWRVRDGEPGCAFDLVVAFVPDSLGITDLDGDGLAEVWLQYTLACTSDVSPATRKLILREGPDKYALRGTTRLPPEAGIDTDGMFVPDPSFDRWPEPFRLHADAQWEAFVESNYFDD